MALTLSSAIFSIPWGYLADKKGTSYTILLFIVFDVIVKLFTVLNKSKSGFLLSMAMLGSTEKTMLILFAPIMIDTLGFKIAQSLLFLKGVTGILAMVLTSGIGIVMAKVPPNETLFFMCFFNVLNVAIGVFLVKTIQRVRS